jgi:fibronectin-binding autotransporter adhesin
MSERPHSSGTYLAKVVLICAWGAFVLYGQQQPKAAAPRGSASQYPTATWTGGGSPGDWADSKNWSWDNDACLDNGAAVPPGTFSDPTSPCFKANVNIPANSGTINPQNAVFYSYIVNFTLGSKTTFQGNMGGLGNTTISAGATVIGGASAGVGDYFGLTGTLTNFGTIILSTAVTGCSILNSGLIKGSGTIFMPYNTSQCGASANTTTGTNAGTIEATAALQFSGAWDNSGGTIRIDGGAVLVCSGAITGGAIINNGGAIGGGVNLEGQVTSLALTVDGGGSDAEVEVDGTLTNTGALTIGSTSGGVSQVLVDSGGTLTAGNIILGVTAGSQGQLGIAAGGTVTPAGPLTIGDNGSGLITVLGSLQAQAIILGNMVGGSGQMNIMPKGTVTYTGQLSAGGTQVSGIVSTEGTATISIEGGGTLTGKEGVANRYDVIGGTANVTVNGAWTNVNGIVTAGMVTVSQGGALNVNCPACYQPSSGLYAFGVEAGTVFVFGNSNGSGNLTTAGGLGTARGATLTVATGASLDIDLMVSDGTLTVNSAPVKADYIFILGTCTVENSGSLAASDFIYVEGPGNLLAETQAVISAGHTFQLESATVTVDEYALLLADVVTVDGAAANLAAGGAVNVSQLYLTSGTVTIQPVGALTMTDPIPIGAPQLVIGGGAHRAVLTINGQLNNVTNMGVYSAGTLTIGNGTTVEFSGPAYIARLYGGTIDVTNGQLVIGTAVSAGQGWVTVGVLGVLSGGVICPAGQSQLPGCAANTLFAPGGSKVIGYVSNRGGTVSISDPTTINISQGYQQTSGTLELEIDGTQQGQYDQLIAGGSIQITGGTVKFVFGNGFAPSSGNSFNLLTATGGVTVSGATFTSTGLANGFNYTAAVSGSQFNLMAQNSGVATTSPPVPFTSTGLSQLSSAAGGVPALAPGSLAAAYAASGTSLATGQPSAPPAPWPTSVNGTSVAILDYTGLTTAAPLTYVSADQVDFLIPDTVALGPALVTITSGTQAVGTQLVTLTDLAPSLFTLNSDGLAAAYAACVSSSGTITTETPFQAVNGAVVAQALNLAACSQTILELYGTGLDDATASGTQVMFGEVAGTVQYAGPGGGFPGLDQINVVIPQSLAGKGSVPVVVSAGGMTSNKVNITIQ